jgi:hypothetical protein
MDANARNYCATQHHVRVLLRPHASLNQPAEICIAAHSVHNDMSTLLSIAQTPLTNDQQSHTHTHPAGGRGGPLRTTRGGTHTTHTHTYVIKYSVRFVGAASRFTSRERRCGRLAPSLPARSFDACESTINRSTIFLRLVNVSGGSVTTAGVRNRLQSRTPSLQRPTTQ